MLSWLILAKVLHFDWFDKRIFVERMEMMELTDFKHKTRIQIRFKDIDKQGHVNNANHIMCLNNWLIGVKKELF